VVPIRRLRLHKLEATKHVTTLNPVIPGTSYHPKWPAGSKPNDPGVLPLSEIDEDAVPPGPTRPGRLPDDQAIDTANPDQEPQGNQPAGSPTPPQAYNPGALPQTPEFIALALPAAPDIRTWTEQITESLAHDATAMPTQKGVASVHTIETSSQPTAEAEVIARSHGTWLPPKWDDRLPTQNELQAAIHERHREARDRLLVALYLHGSPALRNASLSMAQCSSRATFYVSQTESKVRPRLWRCRERMCPICGRARSFQVADQVNAIVAQMQHPRQVILTVASNNKPLTTQLRFLRTAFSRLRRTPWWNRHVTGGAYTIEVTLNADTGQWHPHVHMIVDGSYIPWKELQAYWHRITEGSKVIWVSDVTSRRDSVLELCKYVGKPVASEAWPATELCEYALAVRGQRMVQSFGRWRRYKLLDQDKDLVLAPDTYEVSLGNLMWLTGQGYSQPRELVALIAERWPQFGAYIYGKYAQLETREHAQHRRMKALDRIRGIKSPTPDTESPETKAKRLDPRILVAFAMHRLAEAEGTYERPHDGS